MSTTYSLVCDDCKVKYWAGQRSMHSASLYDDDKVAAFLFAHSDHAIRFHNDHVDDERLYEYKDCESALEASE